MNVSRQMSNDHPRRGAIALIAMITLVLVSMIGASLLKSALAQRRQMDRERCRVQAEWLAEAGLERAAAMLRGNADYSGETWKIAAESLGGAEPGEVQIAVTPDAQQPSQRKISVIADYPVNIEHRARVSKQTVLTQK